MFKSLLNKDPDELFSYDTLAVVRVKDRRLGIANYVLFIIILGYVIGYQIIFKQNFLLKEPPTGGSIEFSLRNYVYNNEDVQNLTYCNNQQISCKFAFLSHNLEESSVFITTRLTVSRIPRVLPQCTEPVNLSSNPECVYNVDSNAQYINKTTYFPIMAEKSTLIVQHQVRGEKTGISQDYTKMEGKIVNKRTKNTIKVFKKSMPKKDYAFGVEDLLKAADVSIDDTDDVFKSKRYNGLVLIVYIDYKNSLSSVNDIDYEITAKAIPGAEFKYEHLEHTDLFPENGQFDPNILTYMNEHGIRIVIKQIGTLGKFDFITLLINFVTGIALIKMSTLIIDLVMVKLLPEKKYYKKCKVSETEDFGDLRKTRKENKANNSENLSVITSVNL